VKTALLGPCMLDSGIFDRSFLQQMVDQHQSGRRDFSTPIWTLMMFEAFQRNMQGELGSLP
jgi:asparagine synthase (glutamine-hydrolysing)